MKENMVGNTYVVGRHIDDVLSFMIDIEKIMSREDVESIKVFGIVHKRGDFHKLKESITSGGRELAQAIEKEIAKVYIKEAALNE